MTQTTTKIKKDQEEIVETIEAITQDQDQDLDADLAEAIDKKLKSITKKDKYFEAVGRRKSSVGRVRLYTKVNGITINGKPLVKYFDVIRFQNEVMAPLEKMKLTDKLGAVIKVNGGGLSSQAEAARLGIARALVVFNPIFKKRLRRLGFLTRDARVVERKKYGLRKARKAKQWSKR